MRPPEVIGEWMLWIAVIILIWEISWATADYWSPPIPRLTPLVAGIVALASLGIWSLRSTPTPKP